MALTSVARVNSLVHKHRTVPTAIRHPASCHLRLQVHSHHQISRAVVRCSAATNGAQAADQAASTSQEADGVIKAEDTEDEQVPGTYDDAMNPQTKLGKAIKAAVDELEHLNGLELGLLTEADELLKKMGYKASLFDVPADAVKVDPEEDEGIEDLVEPPAADA